MSERIVDNPANHGWVEENGKWVWEGVDDGAGLVISDTEPTDKVEGMQWLENTTGKVWIWDGSAWFQFPQGKDGAAGKDGNIADGASDGSQDGVVATWDDAAKQWTPEGNLSFDANGRMYLGEEKANSHFYSNGAIISRRDVGNHFQAEFSDGTEGHSGRHLIGAYNSDTGEYTVRIGTDGNATFSGKVGMAELNTSQIRNVNGGFGIGQGAGNQKRIIPVTTDGQAPGEIDFGSSSVRWSSGYFANQVITRSGVSIGTRDLIETLATLRASTLDETVDVRQALASACDKLIEKFTEMEKTATQGVEDDS